MKGGIRLGLIFAVAMLSLGAGGAKVFADCTGPDATAGMILFNQDIKTLQYCNGTTWIAVGAPNSNGCPVGGHGTGYFVITSETYTGDLEQEATDKALGPADGRDASNKLCLDNLTNNDWMGKADAQARGLLNAGHVKAWLCTNAPAGGCVSDALPNTEYFFAVSGDATKGGASFTADADMSGPGNAANWSGTSYFDGAKQYWTARGYYASPDDEHWPTDANATGGGQNSGNCSVWSDTVGFGVDGISNSTDKARWSATLSTTSCASSLHIVCFVHP